MTNISFNNIKLQFSKMQGCGNDFIMLNAFTQKLPTDAKIMGKLAEQLCDRRFGIGADGILALYPSRQADFQMRLFQPDGSEAEMCGNGIRCAALFALSQGIINRQDCTVETLAGLMRPSISQDGCQVRVNMGQPRLNAAEIPCLCQPPQGSSALIDQPLEIIVNNMSREFKFCAVSMGNPHAVIFVDAPPQNLAVEQFGPLLEHNAVFPARANIEFAQILDPHNIQARVWERSVGETLACGTGACAIAVAAILSGRGLSPINIQLPGGNLQIDWAGGANPVYMTGPAQEVYSGSKFLANLPCEALN